MGPRLEAQLWPLACARRCPGRHARAGLGWRGRGQMAGEVRGCLSSFAGTRGQLFVPGGGSGGGKRGPWFRRVPPRPAPAVWCPVPAAARTCRLPHRYHFVRNLGLESAFAECRLSVDSYRDRPREESVTTAVFGGGSGLPAVSASLTPRGDGAQPGPSTRPVVHPALHLGDHKGKMREAQTLWAALPSLRCVSPGRGGHFPPGRSPQGTCRTLEILCVRASRSHTHASCLDTPRPRWGCVFGGPRHRGRGGTSDRTPAWPWPPSAPAPSSTVPSPVRGPGVHLHRLSPCTWSLPSGRWRGVRGRQDQQDVWNGAQHRPGSPSSVGSWTDSQRAEVGTKAAGRGSLCWQPCERLTSHAPPNMAICGDRILTEGIKFK